MGSKTPKATTQTVTNAPPGYIQDAQKDVLAQGKTLAAQPYNPYTGQLVQGFSGDQNSAFQNIRDAQGMAQPYINTGAGLSLASAQGINPMQFSGAAVNQYLNPYLDNVAQSTMNNINQTNQIQQNQLRGNAISKGAFGGDRAGIAAAELARNQNLASQQTISGIYSQGYQQAQDMFNKQQAADMTAQQQTAALRQGAAGQLGQFGTDAQKNALQGAQALAAAGAQQQELGQNQLSSDYQQFLNKQQYPFQNLSWLTGLISGNNSGGTSNSSSTQPGPSGASQAIGGATALAALAGMKFADGGVVGYAGGGVPYGGGAGTPYSNPNIESKGFGNIFSDGSVNISHAGGGMGIPTAKAPEMKQDDPASQGLGLLKNVATANSKPLIPGQEAGKSLIDRGKDAFGNIFNPTAAPTGAPIPTPSPLTSAVPTPTASPMGMEGIQAPNLVEGIGNAVNGVGSAIGEGLGTIGSGIAEGVGALGAGLGEAAAGIGSAIAPVAAGAAEGIGSALAFLPLLFSDERMKENKEVVGEMFDGTPIYKYNYKGDPSQTTQMGVMAQDIEGRYPDAVHKTADGIRMVDYDAATANAADKGQFADGGMVDEINPFQMPDVVEVPVEAAPLLNIPGIKTVDATAFGDLKRDGGIDPRDLAIRTILGEAGNQGEVGQAAVAHVLRNRLNSGGYGDKLENVILKPKQFSVWNQGDKAGDYARSIDPNSDQYKKAGDIFDRVNSGEIEDPTKGATHYANVNTVSQQRGGNLPSWLANMPDTVQIGAHTFGKADAGRGEDSVSRPVQVADAGMSDVGVAGRIQSDMANGRYNPSNSTALTPPPTAQGNGSLLSNLGINLPPEVAQGLLAAGLGMMSGTSPYAGVNIGRGGLQGVEAYGQALNSKAQRENLASEIENRKGNLDIAKTKNQIEIRNLLNQENYRRTIAGQPQLSYDEFASGSPSQSAVKPVTTAPSASMTSQVPQVQKAIGAASQKPSVETSQPMEQFTPEMQEHINNFKVPEPPEAKEFDRRADQLDQKARQAGLYGDASAIQKQAEELRTKAQETRDNARKDFYKQEVDLNGFTAVRDQNYDPRKDKTRFAPQAEVAPAKIDRNTGEVVTSVPAAPNDYKGYKITKTSDAQKEFTKEVDLTQANAAQNLIKSTTVLANAFKDITPGATAEKRMEVAKYLDEAGFKGLAKTVAGGDVSAIQVAMKETFETALNKMAGANKRFTQNELFAQIKNMPNTNMTPEAVMTLISGLQGGAAQSLAFQKDWAKANKDGWVDGNKFYAAWSEKNPVDKFVDSARMKIGNLKGLPLPEPDKWLPGVTYVMPDSFSKKEEGIKNELLKSGVAAGGKFKMKQDGTFEPVKRGGGNG